MSLQLFAETWSNIGPRAFLFAGIGAGIGVLVWVANRLGKANEQKPK